MKSVLFIMLKGPQETCDLDIIEKIGGSPRAVLLFEDATYFAVMEEKARKLLSKVDEVFVISDDLRARGMADRKLKEIREVSYPEAVDLIMEKYELTVTV